MIIFDGIELNHNDKVKILKPDCGCRKDTIYRYDEKLTYVINSKTTPRLIRLIGVKHKDYEEATKIIKL